MRMKEEDTRERDIAEHREGSTALAERLENRQNKKILRIQGVAKI